MARPVLQKVRRGVTWAILIHFADGTTTQQWLMVRLEDPQAKK